MIALTDELLRRRLADRAAGAPAISLAPIARSVSAQPRRPSAPVGLRSAFVGPIAAALVVALAIAGGLLTRGTAPSGSAGSDSGASGAASNPSASLTPGPAVAAWTALTWEEVSADAFPSDETIVYDAIALGDGFVAVGTSKKAGVHTGHVWRSDDGRTWERTDDQGLAPLNLTRIMAVNGTLVVLGYAVDATGKAIEPVQLWRSADGRGWTRGPDLPSGADALHAAGGPDGILLNAGRRTFHITPDLTEWVQTTTWPNDVLLGVAAWADGRWILPGTTGTDANGDPSHAAVWTSNDARTWSRAAVERPEGGMSRVIAVDAGLVGIGTGDDVCATCRGMRLLQSTAAWASEDGVSWRRLGWDGQVLSRGFQAHFASDGHRIVVTGSEGFGSTQDSTFRIFETVDASNLTPIAMRGGEPNESALYGEVVVGRHGVVLLPGAAFDVSTGEFHPNVWWGAPTEATSNDPDASSSPQQSAEPTPLVTGCDALGFDARRCAAIVARARERADPPLREADVVAATVTRPTQDTTILGSFPIADVTFDLVRGGTTTVVIRCGLSGSSDRVCSQDPVITIGGGVSHDVPCGGTPGDENHPCATLPPKPRPAAVAASTPLILPTFDVVLDHVGHYEVLVGTASLPDGALSERSGTLADPRPTSFWIDSGVQIVVRPGKPCVDDHCPSIDSIYHGPFRGPQPVNVYLVFDVVELDPGGAVLEVHNLTVQ